MKFIGIITGLLTSMIWSYSFSQNIERKIIIQGGKFYFTTVDPEFQVATLHIGNMSQSLSEAKQYAIPGGRSLMDPVNPLAWDILGDHLYLVNFIDNANNDKFQALKKIPLSTLKEKEKTTVNGLVEESLYLPAFATNDPYMFVLNRSPVLTNFFFDGIAAGDSSYYLAIANNGEVALWHYNGKRWRQGNLHKLSLTGNFSLYLQNRNVHLLTNSGNIYKISAEVLAPVSQPARNNSLLIINKDNRTVQVMKVTDQEAQSPLKKLIEKKATLLVN